MGMLNVNENARVQALKEEVLFFRNLLDQTVRKNTDSMNRHISTWVSGKLSQDTISHRKHKKYLAKLNKTLADEAEFLLRSLERELSLLMNNQSSESGLEVG